MTDNRLQPHTWNMTSDGESTMKMPAGSTMPDAVTAMPATFTIESCHSTWVFDADRMRFRRVLKDAEVGGQLVATGWRPYSRLDASPESETFTVYLNDAGSRMIRTWRHTVDCRECGVHRTGELSLEMLRNAISS
jgi:hypothetical protein